ncbi:MAG: hypothetical protein ACR2G4_02120 [Pyrinomonadaceae bacterium]
METIIKIIYIGVSGTAVVIACVYLAWRARSIYQLRRAGPPPPQRAHRKAIWRDPGAVEQFDFSYGPGVRDSAPAPPFHNTFVGSRELNGLKIMLMLTSNWNNKDVRDKFSRERPRAQTHPASPRRARVARRRSFLH